MSILNTPDFVTAVLIFVSLAGIILATMTGFLVHRLIKDHAGIMLFHFRPIRVRNTVMLADRDALERASRRLQNVVMRFQ